MQRLQDNYFRAGRSLRLTRDAAEVGLADSSGNSCITYRSDDQAIFDAAGCPMKPHDWTIVSCLKGAGGCRAVW